MSSRRVDCSIDERDERAGARGRATPARWKARPCRGVSARRMVCALPWFGFPLSRAASPRTAKGPIAVTASSRRRGDGCAGCARTDTPAGARQALDCHAASLQTRAGRSSFPTRLQHRKGRVRDRTANMRPSTRPSSRHEHTGRSSSLSRPKRSVTSAARCAAEPVSGVPGQSSPQEPARSDLSAGSGFGRLPCRAMCASPLLPTEPSAAIKRRRNQKGRAP